MTIHQSLNFFVILALLTASAVEIRELEDEGKNGSDAAPEIVSGECVVNPPNSAGVFKIGYSPPPWHYYLTSDIISAAIRRLAAAGFSFPSPTRTIGELEGKFERVSNVSTVSDAAPKILSRECGLVNRPISAGVFKIENSPALPSDIISAAFRRLAAAVSSFPARIIGKLEFDWSSNTSTRIISFDDLPSDLWDNIVTCLPQIDQMRGQLVCKTWKEISVRNVEAYKNYEKRKRLASDILGFLVFRELDDLESYMEVKDVYKVDKVNQWVTEFLAVTNTDAEFWTIERLEGFVHTEFTPITRQGLSFQNQAWEPFQSVINKFMKQKKAATDIDQSMELDIIPSKKGRVAGHKIAAKAGRSATAKKGSNTKKHIAFKHSKGRRCSIWSFYKKCN